MGNRFVEMGLSAPVNVTWEVSYACNLSCIHCLSDSGPKRQGELSTGQCLQVIDQLAAARVFQLNIGGGEPFLRPDFLDIMDYAHQKRIVTCISTNGTLIDDDTARRLAKDLVYIQVSLDGATAAANDAIRGRGSFEKAVSALSCLRKHNIEVSVNTVLTQRSYPELDEMVVLAAAYGAKLRVSRFRPAGRGKGVWNELNITSEQMVAFSDWLSRHLAVSTGDSFFSVSSEDRRALGLNMCGACKLTCCLSPRGDIFPCAFLQEPEFHAGTLPVDHFPDIWFHSSVFASFRRLEIKSCESCHRFEMCHGGCPAIAYHMKNKLGVPDPECLVNCVTVKPLRVGVN